MENGTLHWNVLNVAPKAEQKTGALLARLGYTNYVPVQKQLRNWSDRKKWVNVVLFPSYVFVETSPQRRNGVFAVPYVHRYLKAGDEIATLREAEMALIRSLGTLENPVQITHSGFLAGDKVEVVRGPLQGFSGTILNAERPRKLQLQIQSLGFFAQVEIDELDVKLFLG